MNKAFVYCLTFEGQVLKNKRKQSSQTVDLKTEYLKLEMYTMNHTNIPKSSVKF